MKEKPKIYWQDCDHFSPEFRKESLEHLKDFIDN